MISVDMRLFLSEFQERAQVRWSSVHHDPTCFDTGWYAGCAGGWGQLEGGKGFGAGKDRGAKERIRVCILILFLLL